MIRILVLLILILVYLWINYFILFGKWDHILRFIIVVPINLWYSGILISAWKKE